MNRFKSMLLVLGLAACGSSANDSGVLVDAGVVGTTSAAVSVAPTLKPGVDPSIFLPTVIAGYHPTAAELAIEGKACAVDADCANPGGRVVFSCSTPYYGQAQCQGDFPPGDQVEPPAAQPSCAYYDCPTGYQCETEAESASVTCLADDSAGHDASPHGGGGGSDG